MWCGKLLENKLPVPNSMFSTACQATFFDDKSVGQEKNRNVKCQHSKIVFLVFVFFGYRLVINYYVEFGSEFRL